MKSAYQARYMLFGMGLMAIYCVRLQIAYAYTLIRLRQNKYMKPLSELSNSSFDISTGLLDERERIVCVCV